MKLWKLFFLTDLDFKLAFPKSIFLYNCPLFHPFFNFSLPLCNLSPLPALSTACFISPTMRCLQGNGEERTRVFLRAGVARHCPPAGPDLSICPSRDHHEQVPQLPGHSSCRGWRRSYKVKWNSLLHSTYACRSACLPQTLRPKLPLRKARCKNIMKHPSRVWQLSLCLAFLLRSFWSQQFW